MTVRTSFFMLIGLFFLASCENQEPEFPLYKYSGFPLEDIQLGGLLAEYLHSENVNADIEYIENSSNDEIDSVKLETFDLNSITNNNIEQSVRLLNQAAGVYANSGDKKMLKLSEDGWKVLDSKFFSTWGLSPVENEHVALIDWLRLNVTLFRLTGDQRYMSAFEFCIYNAMQGQEQLRGWAETLKEEILPFLYTRYLDEVYVNVFGSSSMQYMHTTGGMVRIVQQTDYPYDGLVKLKFEVEDKRYVDLHIRIPEWAENATVTVGGVKYKAIPGEYAQVTKRWKTGDVVEIILPMKPEVAEKDDLHGNEFALQYGPLMLSTAICDSTDNSEKYTFKGTDPFPYLRFASVPGKMPLFTFSGFSDTTVVFQPAFSLQQQCGKSWIRWDKKSE